LFACVSVLASVCVCTGGGRHTIAHALLLCCAYACSYVAPMLCLYVCVLVCVCACVRVLACACVRVNRVRDGVGPYPRHPTAEASLLTPLLRREGFSAPGEEKPFTVHYFVTLCAPLPLPTHCRVHSHTWLGTTSPSGTPHTAHRTQPHRPHGVCKPGCCAVLCCAVLCCPVLRCTVLCCVAQAQLVLYGHHNMSAGNLLAAADVAAAEAKMAKLRLQVLHTHGTHTAHTWHTHVWSHEPCIAWHRMASHADA
jgi:hypothetical protein